MSKAKYEKGERITSLDELREQQFIYLPFGIRHAGFVQSMSFRTLCMYMDRGIYKAKLKDECKQE